MKCINLDKFDPDDLVFGCPEDGRFGDGTRFVKKSIGVLRSDGMTSPLYISTDTCFSFGIQKNKNYGGYSIPLVLLNKSDPTDKQIKFIRVMKKIMSACQPTPKSCFYGKKDSLMYVKLDCDKDYDEILTYIYEKDSTKEINPEKYIGKKNCLAKVIIEISSIFVTDRVSLQMKAKTIVFSKLNR